MMHKLLSKRFNFALVAMTLVNMNCQVLTIVSVSIYLICSFGELFSSFFISFSDFVLYQK